MLGVVCSRLTQHCQLLQGIAERSTGPDGLAPETVCDLCLFWQAAVRQAGELFLGLPSSSGQGLVLARLQEDLSSSDNELVFRPPLDGVETDEAAAWQVLG